MPNKTISTSYSFPRGYFSSVVLALKGKSNSTVLDLPLVKSLAHSRGSRSQSSLPYIPTLRDSFAGNSQKVVFSAKNERNQPLNGKKAIASKPKTKNFIKRAFRKSVVLLSLILLSASLLYISISILPNVYFSVTGVTQKQQITSEDGTPIGGKFTDGVASRSATQIENQPAIDTSLPKGTWIIIPRIGVRTEIQEGESQTEALEHGIWRVPGYGQPGQTGLPVILAGHRYGYTWWWQDNYWKYNSFHLLPETEPGDIIEIISGQRKYTYEIYAGEEGKEITDYQADLILYTCKYLSSPVRFFRYARLVDLKKNTQVK